MQKFDLGIKEKFLLLDAATGDVAVGKSPPLPLFT